MYESPVTSQRSPLRESVIVWSMPLASTSVLPAAVRQVMVMTALAPTDVVTPSSAGWTSRMVTAQDAVATDRPRFSPRSAVPAASLASVRASALSAGRYGASAAAGSSAVIAAARACR